MFLVIVDYGPRTPRWAMNGSLQGQLSSSSQKEGNIPSNHSKAGWLTLCRHCALFTCVYEIKIFGLYYIILEAYQRWQAWRVLP